MSAGTRVEQVVLLDESGAATGTADKAGIHHADTPLHLAFSCYVLDADDRLLLTRRAATKATWPATWTNTACGHPAPGESVADAAVRRCREELGLSIRDVRLVLPAFRYRATMADGVVENEMCPVLVARATEDPRPDPAEVDDWRWVPWTTFAGEVTAGGRDVSPWCGWQVEALLALGPSSASWPTASDDLLPAAARH